MAGTAKKVQGKMRKRGMPEKAAAAFGRRAASRKPQRKKRK